MAQIAPYQYDPKKVIVTFLGQLVTGYADGTFIEVERNEQAMTLYVGADGESTRVRSANRSGKITLTLSRSSPMNDVLSTAANQDEQLGTGMGPFTLQDLFGRTIVSAAAAWVQKMASVGFSKDMDTREWVLETDVLDQQVGGSF